MSTTRRAYDLMRGYVNNEWERIKGVEDSYAEQELQAAIDDPRTGRTSTAKPEPEATRPTPTPDNKERACQILGVQTGCEFALIRVAFERLNKRSEPTNFPQNSPEAAQAETIQKRVRWAYAVLTEGMDSTEVRFGSLEIE